jgi:hypothetical protein
MQYIIILGGLFVDVSLAHQQSDGCVRGSCLVPSRSPYLGVHICGLGGWRAVPPELAVEEICGVGRSNLEFQKKS